MKNFFDEIEIYKTWSPVNCEWSQWAKPVIFKDINQAVRANFSVPVIRNLDNLSKFNCRNTAIFVDLPNSQSVACGIALAKLGFRPIPLFNGVDGPNPVVDVRPLRNALVSLAPELSDLVLDNQAAPAFLLDSLRNPFSNVAPGLFDNRWSIFQQDVPSVNYLVSQGIENIIVIGNNKSDDLAHILFNYQKRVKVYQLKHFDGEITELAVHRPAAYYKFVYRTLVLLGFRRNCAGGFGGVVPDTTSRTYGVG